MTQGFDARLDGIRAFAVIAVFIGHSELTFLSGGTLGVDVFFVLSGFLIARNLLRDHDADGIRLGNFYARRARRLLPALGLTLVAVGVTEVIAPHVFRLHDPLPFVGALTYSTNYIVAYAVDFVDFQPLAPLWSLSVEEHFYLAYPLLVGWSLRRRGHASLPGHLVVISAVVVLRGVQAIALRSTIAEGAWHGLYFPTHLRMDGLLLGCALAVLLHQGRPRFRVGPAPTALALAALVALVLGTQPYDATYYLVAIPLAGLASLIVIARIVEDPAALRWLGVRPLAWAGRRSYGIYLFQLPVIRLSRSLVWPHLAALPGMRSLPASWTRPSVAFVLTLTVSELSYRLLEARFLSPRRPRGEPGHATDDDTSRPPVVPVLPPATPAPAPSTPG